jgi:hypothetical protein
MKITLINPRGLSKSSSAHSATSTSYHPNSGSSAARESNYTGSTKNPISNHAATANESSASETYASDPNDNSASVENTQPIYAMIEPATAWIGPRVGMPWARVFSFLSLREAARLRLTCRSARDMVDVYVEVLQVCIFVPMRHIMLSGMLCILYVFRCILYVLRRLWHACTPRRSVLTVFPLLCLFSGYRMVCSKSQINPDVLDNGMHAPTCHGHAIGDWRGVSHITMQRTTAVKRQPTCPFLSPLCVAQPAREHQASSVPPRVRQHRWHEFHSTWRPGQQPKP